VDGALRSSSCLQAGARWVSLSHRRLAWAESVMGHIQHLILESLVKMDHFQKEPQPLNFKRDHWGTRGSKEPVPKEPTGNPAQTECPLWVKDGTLSPPSRNVRLSGRSGHFTDKKFRGARTAILDKAAEVALRTMAPEMIIFDRIYMFVPFQSDAAFRTETL
jgi:hypothetical protein